MMDQSRRSIKLPSQRVRIPRDRCDGTTVPGVVALSSCEGLAGALPAGVPTDTATAKTIMEGLTSARRGSFDSGDPDSGEESSAVMERTVILETSRGSPKTRGTSRIRSRVFTI